MVALAEAPRREGICTLSTLAVLCLRGANGNTPMGLYRFHIRHAAGLVEDEEGTELPDLAAAFAEALRCTRELMEDVSASGGLQLEIADEAGRIVLMVPIYGTGGSNPRKEQAHAA